MEKVVFFMRFFALCVGCLLGGNAVFAQPVVGTNLPLVAETDFSVSGGDDDYWHSLDMVIGWLTVRYTTVLQSNLIMPL